MASQVLCEEVNRRASPRNELKDFSRTLPLEPPGAISPLFNSKWNRLPTLMIHWQELLCRSGFCRNA